VVLDAASLPRTRLDRALGEALARAGRPAASRGEIQRWIDGGRVLLDGVALRQASSRAPAHGVIEVRPSPGLTTELVPDPGVRFDVVFEDAHLVVVDKPAGLVVHPARGHREATLVHGLVARPGWPHLGPDPRDPEGALRPGVVHRIDRGTSGLLVVAKTAAAREGLKALFARHDIEREYVAIVAGEARDATIDTPHGRHPTDRVRMTSRSGARRAITHVRVVERLAGATVVACRLETGRTHQIRVHLAEVLGTPIVGDPLYGRPPRGLVGEVWRELGRQALHAARLGFVHPVTGAPVAWESPLPEDLERALARLRAAARI
jgi:23S rRNA pseudouridine1911/1915/1917 synthase